MQYTILATIEKDYIARNQMDYETNSFLMMFWNEKRLYAVDYGNPRVTNGEV